MSLPTDEHLHLFRVQSDKAFLAMQVSADKEMEKFLKSYSEGAVIGSFQTPDMSWGIAPVPAVRQAMGTVRRKVKQVAEAVDKATGRKSRGSAGHGSHETFNDFGELGDSVKQELKETGQEVAEGARGWLKSASMDLGERAKREAAAMREAARKAMQEETSLRGLKERAQQELQAAKQRMKTELLDAKSDAMADLEGMALDQIGEAQEKGFSAAEAAQKRAGLELEDLFGGNDPKR